MIVLLWLSLILIPLMTGMGLLSVFYAKKHEYEITVSEGFVLGSIACIGLMEVIHMMGLVGDLALAQVKVWLGIAILVLTCLAVVFLLISVIKQKRYLGIFTKNQNERTIFPFLFLALLFVQLLYVYCEEALVTSGDIILETVQSFLAEDGIYRVMPLTGEVSELGLPLRYKILCLPTLYAVLCDGFRVDAQLLVCNIIPVVVFAGMYFSYYYLSGVLFGKSAIGKRYLFLLLVAILIFFMDGGVASNGYGGLHAGYLGTTVRNLILVPYVFAASLEKRWWKAVLCVLAEACIAWTFWGCGVCLVIGMGMFILTLVDARCPKLRNFMQIFLKKEDLA